MTDAPTIAERYRRATSSSNLKVEEHRKGDPDILIAAGWSDSLDIKLYRLAAEFDQVAQDARKIKSTTDALLTLSHLKSLTGTRVALVRFAIDSAKAWGIKLDEQVIGIISGKVLSAFLDPNCHRCNGTGAIGGYDGKAANICRLCGGSGKSRHKLGENDQERYLAHRLLSVLDAKMHEADAILHKYLRTR